MEEPTAAAGRPEPEAGMTAAAGRPEPEVGMAAAAAVRGLGGAATVAKEPAVDSAYADSACGARAYAESGSGPKRP